jgi:hypothetical protein
MSIQDSIEQHVKNGRLHKLPSLVTGDDTARILYVSDEIFADVDSQLAVNADDTRLFEFRQTLDAWLEHGEFSVAENPDLKPSDAMLARLRPVNAEMWDIRSIVPRPGIRALGAFIGQDTFVALTWDYRENLDEAGAFDAEVKRAVEAWQNLFGQEKPFKGASLDEYLTNFYAV